MNVAALRQRIHDLPDSLELRFSIDGEIYEIDTIVPVPEWCEVYFGTTDEELAESIMEYEAESVAEDDMPVEEREAWVKGLEEHENQQDAVESCATEGGQIPKDISCCLTPEPSTKVDKYTEMM